MWPRDDLTPAEIDGTDSAIRQIVGPGIAIDKVMANRGTMLLFWRGILSSEEQMVQIEDLHGVRGLLDADDEDSKEARADDVHRSQRW